MTLEQFNAYAKQGFNHIPVYHQLLADLETPLSVYMKLANKEYSYLFESVHGGEKWGRYSIIGLPADEVIKVVDQEVTIINKQKTKSVEKCSDPLSWLEKYKQNYKTPVIADLPTFCGGLVGYFAYDVVQYIEPKLTKYKQSDPLQTPDILLMVF